MFSRWLRPRPTPTRPRRRSQVPFVTATELERRELLAADAAEAIAVEVAATNDATTPAILRVGEVNASDSTPAEGQVEMASRAASTSINLRSQTTREIVIVDADVRDLSQLGSSLPQHTEFVLLDGRRDAIEQITEVLSRHRDLQAIHLVSHGDRGVLKLAGRQMGADDLVRHAELLQQWRGSLSDNADILLYGCDVASGSAGTRFIQTFSQLTGADVAASTNRTGSCDGGGDWTLERHTGVIESDVFASLELQSVYNHTLPISIQAAGATGTENMALQIDGVTVASWNGVGGNFNTGVFQTFTYAGATGIAPDRIRVAFTNDAFSGSVDRNLRVDSISVDGTVYQTEDPSVFSTGTWQAGVGITPGYKQSEILHANGYFQYASTGPITGTRLTIWAAGQTNTESMQLEIDGQVVQAWTNIGGNASTGQYVAYTYQSEDVITPNRVRVAFTNDRSLNGSDRNLRVDRLVINNVAYQTEAGDVYSTGTWKPSDGIVAGYRQSEFLHANGYFQFDADNPPRYGQLNWELASTEANEGAGSLTFRVLRSQGTDGPVTVAYRTIAGSATAASDFEANQGVLRFATGQTEQTVTLNVLEDTASESTETLSLVLENPTGGAVLGSQSAHTVTLLDNDSQLPSFTDFRVIDSLKLNGSATRAGNVLQLTPPEGGLASAFYRTPLLVNDATSFQTQFQFRIRDGQGTGGADGMVFMLQNSAAGLNALSVTEGMGLGYWNIANSLGIEFDTFQNAWDPDNNHIAVFANGQMDRPLAVQRANVDLNSGNVVSVWVEYSGLTNQLSIFMSGDGSKPLEALLNTTVDLVALVGNQAYMGFSAATGGLVNRHELLNWQVTAQSPPVPASAGVIGMETSSIQVREGQAFATFAVLRARGSEGTVTVDYRTIEGSAVAGLDFVNQSGTLVFAPGVTRQTIDVPLLDDALREAVESFALTIDNVTGGATLLAPRTATALLTDNDVRLPSYGQGFAGATDLRLNGSASIEGSILQLTPPEGGYASAYVIDPLIVTPRTSFQTSFEFRIRDGQGTGGADGMVWMLQNSPAGLSALATGEGQDLGYRGTIQSLAIEFDTYKNPVDINDNHISVFTGGNMTVPLATRTAPIDLNSGASRNVWIDYNGDADFLSVFIAATPDKPIEALLTVRVDLAAQVGEQAYVGFSAATGGLTNRHEVIAWSFDTTTPPILPPTTTTEARGETMVSGLFLPTAVTWSPDGTNMYIAEKDGIVRVVRNGQLQATPLIDIRDKVNSFADRGLLDIAVHPNLAQNPYLYLLYTYEPPEAYQHLDDPLAGPDQAGNRAGRLVRVTLDAASQYTQVIAGSEVVLLGTNSTWQNFNAFVNSTIDFNEPAAGILPDGTNLRDFIASDSTSHSVAALKFGPDGALYVSIGDGTSYNQVDVRTVRVQNIDNLSGKVLRIDPLTGAGLADNPFYNGDANANRSKVYMYGLRNPFRIAIDSTTGQLFIGDVGWGAWEEVNTGPAGSNFGWPYYEGGNGNNLQTPFYRDLPQAQTFYASGQVATPSILALNHGTDGINALILGDRYRGELYGSEYVGDLFFNDLGQGIVRHLSFDASGAVSSIDTFATNALYVVQMVQGPDGAMYYVDLDDGIIGRWVL